MKQKGLPINFYIPKTIVLTVLAIVSICCLCGCATTIAIEWAQEKSSPELNCEHLEIKNVLSAVKQENGDISICVELVDYNKPEYPKVTITLPCSGLTGAIAEGVNLDPGESGCPSFDSYYPIEKTQEGCEKTTSGSLSSSAVLPIEKLDLREDGRDDLYDLLISYNKDSQIKEKIYEVSFVEYEGATEKVSRVYDVILIYWPTQIDQQGAHPIMIVGTYEDQSYADRYLILPLTLAIDAVILVGGYFVYAWMHGVNP